MTSGAPLSPWTAGKSDTHPNPATNSGTASGSTSRSRKALRPGRSVRSGADAHHGAPDADQDRELDGVQQQGGQQRPLEHAARLGPAYRQRLDDDRHHGDRHEGGGDAGQSQQHRRETVPAPEPDPPLPGSREVPREKGRCLHYSSPTCCRRSRAPEPSPRSVALRGAGVTLVSTLRSGGGATPGRSGYSQLSEVAMIRWAGSLTR